MLAKNHVAKQLIAKHFEVEPHLQAVYLIITDDDGTGAGTIKLLEINAATVATGSITPFEFAPTEDVPFTTVIAEVTPGEFDQLYADSAKLPPDWRLDKAQKFTRDNAAT